jgi:hypothetical protein
MENEHVLWEKVEPDPVEARAKNTVIKVSLIVDIVALIMVGYGVFSLSGTDSLGDLSYVIMVALAAMATFQILFLSYNFSPVTKTLVIFSDGLRPPQSIIGRLKGTPDFISKDQLESFEVIIFKFGEGANPRGAEMMRNNPRMKLRAKLKNGKNIGLAERSPDIIRGASERMSTSWGVPIKESFLNV